MTCAPSMPLWCGDYLKDTTDLTLEEHGAYLMILQITWATGGKPLPDDDETMARRLRITKERWTKKLKPVLSRFFDLSDGTWRNNRLEREWRYVQQRLAVKRANGSKGGRPAGDHGPDHGPGNGEVCTATAQCNNGQDHGDNPLKNNGTGKPIGSGSVNLRESTQPQTLESLEESSGGVDSNPARGREAEPPPPPPDPAPSPSVNVIPIGRQARELKPCDPGWTLPPEWEAWAMSLNHPSVEIAGRRFKQHWRLRDKRCRAMSLGDLRESWEVWILEDLERKHASGSHGSEAERLRHGLARAFSDVLDPGSADTGGSGGGVAFRHR